MIEMSRHSCLSQCTTVVIIGFPWEYAVSRRNILKYAPRSGGKCPAVVNGSYVSYVVF